MITRSITRNLYFLSLTLLTASPLSAAPETKKPNVLFIAVDDLNDWIGCMKGHPQTITPNFDRLAKSGMLFTNAHCVAPGCNPSRTAVMTGRSPHKTGVYSNRQNMRDVLPNESILSKYFSNHGYWSAGSGKILHYFIDAPSWDEFVGLEGKDWPIPYTYYPEKRPVSLKVAGPWQYGETDWGPMPVDDKEFGGDYTVSEYVSKQLTRKHDKPFFLACGIYRPHEPWFVPAKYFEPFPLDKIQLPPAYKENDLDDLPAPGKKMGANRYFAHIQEQKQWKQGIQGYLASIYFADTMLGRVLDALEKGPHKDNTIVILWSDHGWHLGSKQHWQKFTAWRMCTRVPMMMKVPKGASTALPNGITPGSVCDSPVSLISIFPTLTELCGLPNKNKVDGKSIVPLLKDPTATVDPVAITYLDTVRSIGVSGKDWRYIHYADSSEELYHISKDPYEWSNLASNPEHEDTLKEFRTHIPKTFAPKPKVKVQDLSTLLFQPYKIGDPVPVSKPDGPAYRLAFINQRSEAIHIVASSSDGKRVKKGIVEPNKTVEIKSRPGEVWLITKADGTIIGHTRLKDRMAKVIIK